MRQLALAAGVHHTYVSKLERGDRRAPEDGVVEALAAALEATPAQLDQLRWRAGLTPRGSGAPGTDDPTLTLVAEALGDPALPEAQRDHLRRTIAQVVHNEREPAGAAPDSRAGGRTPFDGAGAAGGWDVSGGGVGGTPLPGVPPGVSAAPGAPSSARLPATPPVLAEAPPDGRAATLAALLGGWQTVDEAAGELRVPPSYVLTLVQSGQLRAWVLPGAPPGSPAGVRLRREDVLALLQPYRP